MLPMTDPLTQGDQAAIGSFDARSIMVRRPTGRKTSLVKWLMLSLLVVGMVIMGLLTLLMIGVLNTGSKGLVIGMIVATIPVPLYVAFVIWLDRFELEPWWMLGLAFFWGATGAVFFAFIVNTISAEVVANSAGQSAGTLFAMSISAPIVEELLKAVVLVGIYLLKRKEFNGIVDGIVYAGMVGLGFAMTENFSYYGQNPYLFLLRGTILAFGHPLFTSMTGIGLGIASGSKNIFVKLIAPVVGLTLAIILHSLNNSTIPVFHAALGEEGNGVGLLLVIIAVPSFCFCVLLLTGFGLYRESKKIKRFLQTDVEVGTFTSGEVIRIASIFRRFWASFPGFWRGGFKGWYALMRFHHIATELAFFRANLARGVYLHDAHAVEQENEYLSVLKELRSKLPPL
jgi:protease PrsW